VLLPPCGLHPLLELADLALQRPAIIRPLLVQRADLIL
jgi:hypothetical protein